MKRVLIVLGLFLFVASCSSTTGFMSTKNDKIVADIGFFAKYSDYDKYGMRKTYFLVPKEKDIFLDYYGIFLEDSITNGEELDQMFNVYIPFEAYKDIEFYKKFISKKYYKQMKLNKYTDEEFINAARAFAKKYKVLYLYLIESEEGFQILFENGTIAQLIYNKEDTDSNLYKKLHKLLIEESNKYKDKEIYFLTANRYNLIKNGKMTSFFANNLYYDVNTTADEDGKIHNSDEHGYRVFPKGSKHVFTYFPVLESKNDWHYIDEADNEGDSAEIKDGLMLAIHVSCSHSTTECSTKLNIEQNEIIKQYLSYSKTIPTKTLYYYFSYTLNDSSQNLIYIIKNGKIQYHFLGKASVKDDVITKILVRKYQEKEYVNLIKYSKTHPKASIRYATPGLGLIIQNGKPKDSIGDLAYTFKTKFKNFQYLQSKYIRDNKKTTSLKGIDNNLEEVSHTLKNMEDNMFDTEYRVSSKTHY